MKKIGWYIVLALIIGLQACKGDDDKPQGSPICASDQFHYINELKVNNSSASGQHVDFTFAPYYVTLTSTFNEEVSWEIKITGGTSGAVKTYTGISSSVNVKWYGNADEDVFFQSGETCTISFTPSCKSSVTINVVVDHYSIFDHYGYLLLDLDYSFPEYEYISDVAGIEAYVRNVDTVLAQPSPQGGRCQKLYAPLYHSGWYIGGYGSSTDNIVDYVGTTSSDSIYLNFYLKGNANTVTMISIKEDVGGDEYIFNKSITINWTGWKLVSYSLTELAIGVPANIKNIDFQAGPNIYNAQTECYVDFVILTKGKAFSGPN